MPHSEPDFFQQLCARVERQRRITRTPGAALGVFYQGREFTAGFGRTSIENPLPVTPETLFQVGSISKTFTATALMRLTETQNLNLDTPLASILPHFSMRDPETQRRVTLRHLLTHTGGWLGDYFDDFGCGDDALARMVEKIGSLPQITPLGAAWSYCNTGFNLAGRALEILEQQPYESVIQQRLLTPLGMNLTFFYPSDLLITHRFAVGHQRVGKNVRVARPWAIGRAGNPVGGVVSSVRDLLTYARFHMSAGQGILSERTLQSMRKEQADAGGRGKMGLSWFIRQAPWQGKSLFIYGHGGATHGQQAVLYFLPQEDFAVALLTNSDAGGRITAALLDWALEIYFQTRQPIPEPYPLTRTALQEFAGLYELPLSAFQLTPSRGALLRRDLPRGGFPTPQTPPGPPEPDVRLAFYAPDRVIGLDEPYKNAPGEFLRDEHGQVRFLRLGGRLHPKQNA